MLQLFLHCAYLVELEPGVRGQRGGEDQRSRRLGLPGPGELGREFEDDQAFIEMIKHSLSKWN